MKKILTFCILILLLSTPMIAEDSPWNIYAELDMYLGYKMGIKYEMNNKFDLVSSFGVNALFPSQYCYSLYTSYKSISYNELDVAVNFGIIQGVFDNTSSIEDRYFVFSPGVTMQVSYNINNRISIGAQGGMVLMIGHENEAWASSLEPYAGITFSFSEK